MEDAVRNNSVDTPCSDRAHHDHCPACQYGVNRQLLLVVELSPRFLAEASLNAVVIFLLCGSIEAPLFLFYLITAIAVAPLLIRLYKRTVCTACGKEKSVAFQDS